MKLIYSNMMKLHISLNTLKERLLKEKLGLKLNRPVLQLNKLGLQPSNVLKWNVSVHNALHVVDHFLARIYVNSV